MSDPREDPLPADPPDDVPHSVPDADPPFDLSETLVSVRQVQDGAAIADGERDPWERLAPKVERYLKYTHGRASLPRGYEHADLLQNVLARMVQDLPRLEVRTQKEFWSWVRTLAEHALIDLRRRESAERRGGGRAVARLDAGTDSNPGLSAGEVRDPAANPPSMFARIRELASQELQCVESLGSEEQRQVYLLRRRDGLDYAEIAGRVGRSKADTIKVIYHRARGKVVACLLRRLDDYRIVDE